MFWGFPRPPGRPWPPAAGGIFSAQGGMYGEPATHPPTHPPGQPPLPVTGGMGGRNRLGHLRRPPPPGRSLDLGHQKVEIESKSGQIATSPRSGDHSISGRNERRDPAKVRPARILTRSRPRPAGRSRVSVRPPEGGRSIDLEFSPPEIERKSGRTPVGRVTPARDRLKDRSHAR